jgi:hypothetical protein
MSTLDYNSTKETYRTIKNSSYDQSIQSNPYYCEIHKPTIFERVGNFVNRKINKGLANTLPVKTKKLFFVSSLIASIVDIKDSDIELLERINTKFQLSNSSEALALPIWMGVKLWKTRVPKNLCLKCVGDEPLHVLSELKGKKLTQGEMRVAANSVINCAPIWLLYGSRRSMRNDFVEVLQFVQEM